MERLIGARPTMRCISLKLSMAWPSMLKTLSPGRKPARSAALPGVTMSTFAAVIRSPKMPKIMVKMTTARTKLAIGPAATMAARWPKDLPRKLWACSSGVNSSGDF